MTSTEARDIMFGEFIEFLKTKKNCTSERFSMDVWMSKIWDIWYNEFVEWRKREGMEQDIIKMFNAKKLTEMTAKRNLLEHRQTL